MIIALELGFLFAIMALGVYLTYRVLDFPDLTVDGSFTTGASVAAVMMVNGVNPALASVCAVVAGMLAGTVTGLLHTAGRINPLLAGILTQIALYSVNLRIMGRANVPLLRETTVFTPLREAGLIGTWVSVGVMGLLALAVMVLLDWFLGTDIGVGMRATGDNEEMARSQGIATDRVKLFGLAISNGLVAGCGALVAQFTGFADISMGIGLIVAGLASVIAGQAIFGSRTVAISTFAVLLGSVIYRGVIQIALNVGLNPNDMKLISAGLVVAALVLPRWEPVRRWRTARSNRRMADEVDLVDSGSGSVN